MADTKKRFRVSVLKPNRALRRSLNRASDWTTVYLPADVAAELLALVNDEREALTAAFRLAAATCTQRAGRSWSATLLTAVRVQLRDARVRADATAARIAAENNAEWEVA